MRARPIFTTAVVVSLALVAAACGTKAGTVALAPTTTYAPINAPAIAPGSGPVDVLYAASLGAAMLKIGPAFDKATGYSFVGYPGTSAALASDIMARTKQGDVFISTFTSLDTELEAQANGSWVSWYAAFATTPAYRYTVTILNRSPHTYAADAFVEYLLGAQGEGLLSNFKLNILLPPRVTGPSPTALNSVLPTS